MEGMFWVRALAPISSREPFPAVRLAPSPRPPPSHLPARTSPRHVCPPCESAGRGELQPASELRHVQRHNHGVDVLCACSRPDLQPRQPFPAVRLAPSPPRAPPSHLPARTSPRHVCQPCDSAVRGCLQPATELRHVQGHNHGEHVSCACPRPDLSSREPFPAVPLAPPPANRPFTSRPTPRPRVSSRLHLAPISIHTLSFRRTQPLCPALNLQSRTLPYMLIASQPPPPSGPRTALHLIALLPLRDFAGYRLLVRWKQVVDPLRMGGSSL